jgi:hypothetical protein
VLYILVANDMAFIAMSGVSDVARLDAIKKTLDSVYDFKFNFESRSSRKQTVAGVDTYRDIMFYIEQLLELQIKMHLCGSGVDCEPMDGDKLARLYEEISNKCERCGALRYEKSTDSTCAIL